MTAGDDPVRPPTRRPTADVTGVDSTEFARAANKELKKIASTS
jgi:hypothetical protein